MTTLREDFVSCYHSFILSVFLFWLEGVCINALPGQFGLMINTEDYQYPLILTSPSADGLVSMAGTAGCSF